MNKNFINKILLLALLTLSHAAANAWVAAVDMHADLGGSDNKHQYPAGGETYDRCDTPLSAYSLGPEPDSCHRWGLVFEKVVEVQTEWKPKISGDTHRLPTIKELVRLFDYTNGDGLDYIVKSWVTPDDKTWIISSSYRDIDGYYDNGADFEYLQVFALNASTGEVKAFQRNDLKLCVELDGVTDIGRCIITENDHTVYAIKVKRTRLKDI